MAKLLHIFYHKEGTFSLLCQQVQYFTLSRFHTVRIFTESVEYTTGSALYAKKVPILCSFKFSPITITTFCPSVIGSSRIS